MAYLTPPVSDRKNTLLGASSRMPYYEDIRGKLNSDEEFDRFPDVCEEESSGESEQPREAQQNRTPKRFFKAFATPKRSRSRAEVESGRLGECRPGNKDTQDTNNFFKQFGKPRIASSSTNSSSSIDESSPLRSFKELNTDKTQPTSNFNSRSIGNEQAVPEKLTPRKFGMFGSQKRDSTALSEKMVPRKPANTMSSFFEEAMAYAINDMADEAMDDLLRSRGRDDLEDSFSILEKSTSGSESVVNDMESPVQATNAETSSNKNVEEAFQEPAMNNSSIGEAKQPDSKKASTELVALRQKRTQKPAIEPAKRKSTRQETMQAKKATVMQAGRRASVQRANDQAVNLEATNLEKMTARAAALRLKAKKGIANKVAKKAVGTLQGTTRLSKADRNWKGERMDTTGGIVVVLTDEENADEYVRY